MLLYRPLPKQPDRAFILGAGRFGTNSAIRIHRKWPDCQLHIADVNLEIPEHLPGFHHSFTDAIDLLNKHLAVSAPDDLVVPCIPVHAAFNMVLSRLGFCIPVPVYLLDELPGAVAGSDGCVYCSLSDFLCTADCPEPEGHCTVTGRKRSKALFSLINDLHVAPYVTLVVRSVSALPGVGAFTSGVLSELLDRVRSRQGRYLIATASRCHGVIHGFTH